jgi:peptide/nickel transport system ATP-binding protein
MPYTIGLLGSLPRMDQDATQRLTPITGAPPSLINLPPGCPFTPRCPRAEAKCDVEEPDLIATTSDEHLAACHFARQLGDVEATDLFETSVIDREALADVLSVEPGESS